MGRGQRNAVASYIRLILSHGILIAMEPDSPSVSHWTGEIASFHDALIQHYSVGIRDRIDMTSVWRQAIREATRKLSHAGGVAGSGLSKRDNGFDRACPIGIEFVCDENFQLRALIERLLTCLPTDRSQIPC